MRKNPKRDLQARIYESEESLHDLQDDWTDLAGRADSRIYMSPEWIRNWWICFGRNRQRSVYLITIWHEGRLVALAPFFKGWSEIGPLVTQRRLQMMGSGGSPNEQIGYMDDYGISDFLDFLVDPDYRNEVSGLFLELLGSPDLEVDTITFHQAGDDSFIMQTLWPGIKAAGWRHGLEQTDICPYIDLREQDSIKSFIKGVKSNARRRFRQTLRAIGEDGEYVIRKPETPEEVERACDTMIRLHQDRWNGIGFPGVFSDPRFITFFKKMVRTSQQNGWLWFKEAVDSEGVCAARMILYYQDRYYDYISGFDDDRSSSKYRPGIGLLLDLVRDAIDGGVGRVELLRGEEGYKYDFTKENFRNWKLTVRTAGKRPGWIRLPSLLVRLSAGAYKIGIREKRLLDVQRKQAGPGGMLQGYVSFRWKSVKMKLGY